MTGQKEQPRMFGDLKPVAADGAQLSAADDCSKPAVYIVGDSHVSCFAQKTEMVPQFPAIVKSTHPGVWVCRLGAVLAGTMHRETTTEMGRSKAFSVLGEIAAGSMVFLLFGEIDCRMHIPRRAGFEPERVPETVHATTTNYFAFVSKFCELAAVRGIRVGLISPPPTYDIPSSGVSGRLAQFMSNGRAARAKRVFARIFRHAFHRKSAMRAALMVSYSYSGTTALRNLAAETMRNEIREFCKTRGLLFIDMFAPFLGSSGNSDPQWFWDDIHLHGDSIARLVTQFRAHGMDNFDVPVRKT